MPLAQRLAKSVSIYYYHSLFAPTSRSILISDTRLSSTTSATAFSPVGGQAPPHVLQCSRSAISHPDECSQCCSLTTIEPPSRPTRRMFRCCRATNVSRSSTKHLRPWRQADSANSRVFPPATGPQQCLLSLPSACLSFVYTDIPALTSTLSPRTLDAHHTWRTERLSLRFGTQSAPPCAPSCDGAQICERTGSGCIRVA